MRALTLNKRRGIIPYPDGLVNQVSFDSYAIHRDKDYSLRKQAQFMLLDSQFPEFWASEGENQGVFSDFQNINCDIDSLTGLSKIVIIASAICPGEQAGAVYCNYQSKIPNFPVHRRVLASTLTRAVR